MAHRLIITDTRLFFGSLAMQHQKKRKAIRVPGFCDGIPISAPERPDPQLAFDSFENLALPIHVSYGLSIVWAVFRTCVALHSAQNRECLKLAVHSIYKLILLEIINEV